MKKFLVLVLITFTTGDVTYSDQHFQVLVEADPEVTSNELMEKATDQAKESFPKHYPESTVLAIVPRPTL